jgi:hypothetical protein
MEWRPASVKEVREILTAQLRRCDKTQIKAYLQFSVEPYSAPILRYGKLESVVIVARNSDNVLYYEDVEEGFNISPLAPDGRILEHWCNQDDLGKALNRWIDGRNRRDGNFSPAVNTR